jgi:SecD/SecF fusion protein
MGSRRRNLIVLVLVLALVVASAIAITSKKTVLGLDLSGGTELVYEGRPTPEVPEVTGEDIDRAIEIIRDRVDEFGVSEPEITRIGEDQIEVALPDVQDADRAIAQIGTTAQLYLYDFEPNVIKPKKGPGSQGEGGYNRLIDAVEAASKREPECFQDSCTTTGPTLYLFDRDSLQLLADPAETEQDLRAQFPNDELPAKSKIIDVPQGTLVLGSPPPEGVEEGTAEARVGSPPYFVVRDRPSLSGDEIENPEQNLDQTTNQPIITFDFTDEGRQAFQDVTREIAQRGAEDYLLATGQPGSSASVEDAANFSGSFAIVLDGIIESQPIINFAENPDGIDGRTGAQISGDFTLQEAQDLATVLQIGALPIKLTLVSQSTVSATLGEQALDEGLTAGLIGLGLVLLFLILYYRFLGVVAGLGLLVYALFFLALIKLIPITLTLPGIAGLILTIGVAADSNIVIFERIKEEVRAGRSMLSAINQGYRKGIATIIDANVVTLITAFILFVLASSGVKGFAFTLGIGTIVSLFTAVLFTQAILALLGRSRFLRSPRFLGAGGEGRRWNFDFTGASRWFFSFSGVILAIGAIAFATNQLNLGIDFESGTKIQASLAEPAEVEDVRNALVDGNIDGAETAKIQETEDPDFGENVFQIQGKFPTEQAPEVQTILEDSFGLAEGDNGEPLFDNTTIGPTFGEQIARSAIIAIIFSLLVIAGYVALRFEAKYAVPVLIALVHDVLITGGVYALLGAEVSSATVAAFLTILGYSMYDTIIVFDRIRENVPRMPRAAFSQIVNRSMSEVLTRSLITGLSTVFLIAVLMIFGGDTLRDFALAMGIGVASGTYSSIFIASPVLTEWKEREPAYRSRRARITEAMGYVPTFPEQNVVAKIDEAERHLTPEEVGDGKPAPAPVPAVAAEDEPAALADGPVDRTSPPQPEPEEEAAGVAGRAETGAERTQRSPRRQGRRKQSRRRRKHGRHR